MGRGDKKTAKGKRTKGSFGNSRNRNAIKARLKRETVKKTEDAAAATEVAKPKKATRKKADS